MVPIILVQYLSLLLHHTLTIIEVSMEDPFSPHFFCSPVEVTLRGWASYRTVRIKGEEREIRG